MKHALKYISYFGLALTLLPGILTLKGVISINTHYIIMAAGMVCWFSTAPFWMHGPSLEDEE
jgi:hypothetical protein